MIDGPLLRMIFIFPTLLYATGAAVRIISMRGRKGSDRRSGESTSTKRDFILSLLAESLVLNMLNGFIITFGVGQIGFGIAVTIAGVMVSVFGISSLFTETEAVRELFLTISNIFIIGEVLDLASYSSIASAGLIAGLVVLLLYYTFRISGEFEPVSA